MTITCDIEGTPVPTATWTCDDKPLETDDRHLVEVTPTSVTLTMPDSTGPVSAVYTLKVENPFGTDSVSIKLTIIGEKILI